MTFSEHDRQLDEAQARADATEDEGSEPDFEAMIEARDQHYGGYEAEKRMAMGVDGW